MKKVACLLLVGALGLFGCGGGGGDDDDIIVFPDASNADAPPVGGDCNPVAQTGCAVGEKCALILDQPDIGRGHVGCVPDGTQGIGDACTEATVAGGFDDCTSGGDCYRSTCVPICTTVNDLGNNLKVPDPAKDRCFPQSLKCERDDRAGDTAAR